MRVLSSGDRTKLVGALSRKLATLLELEEVLDLDQLEQYTQSVCNLTEAISYLESAEAD